VHNFGRYTVSAKKYFNVADTSTFGVTPRTFTFFMQMITRIKKSINTIIQQFYPCLKVIEPFIDEWKTALCKGPVLTAQ
jgi:hypothetical protein